MEDLAVTVEEALSNLQAGNIAVADLICRALVQKSPTDAGAWGVLARIAAMVGERGTAER